MARERLIFFGNERLATGVATTAPTLQSLIEDGYDIAAVVSNYQPAQSRKARPLEVEVVAAEHNIPLLLPARPVDILDQLAAYQAQAAVLVAYGRIVPQSVIDIFPRGIINIHPSLLPLHRGPVPIEQVILDGATETGVSIMQLTAKMDAGPTYTQARSPLSGHETKQELADRLLNLGKDLLLEQLPLILAGTATLAPQDDTAATYDKLISKSDGLIGWSKPATQIEREVRAYAGWPGSRTTIDGAEVTITAASLLSEAAQTTAAFGTPFRASSGELAVTTGQGCLVIDRLKPAGKRDMTGREFLSGHRL